MAGNRDPIQGELFPEPNPSERRCSTESAQARRKRKARERTAAWRAARAKPLVPKECPEFRKQFLDARRRFCSSKCQKASYKRRKQEAYEANPELKAESRKRQREYSAKPKSIAKSNARARNRRANDPVARAKWNAASLLSSKRARLTPTGRAKELHKAARDRARTKGLDFSLSVDWVHAKLEAGVCEYTGLRFDLSPAPDSHRNPLAPSLDQLIAGAGYTEENTRAVISVFNIAKSDWPLQLFVEVIAKMAKGIRRSGRGPS
jgi:hypothetical protein